jgi:hypothetical protein
MLHSLPRLRGRVGRGKPQALSKRRPLSVSPPQAGERTLEPQAPCRPRRLDSSLRLAFTFPKDNKPSRATVKGGYPWTPSNGAPS